MWAIKPEYCAIPCQLPFVDNCNPCSVDSHCTLILLADNLQARTDVRSALLVQVNFSHAISCLHEACIMLYHRRCAKPICLNKTEGLLVGARGGGLVDTRRKVNSYD